MRSSLVIVLKMTFHPSSCFDFLCNTYYQLTLHLYYLFFCLFVPAWNGHLMRAGIFVYLFTVIFPMLGTMLGAWVLNT